jgi:hypothetical protein
MVKFQLSFRLTSLVIKENMSKNNYCMECAALILRKAREELDGLTRELGTAEAPSWDFEIGMAYGRFS